MNNPKIIITGTLTSLLILISSVTTAQSQNASTWGIGASFEMRDEEPENGFGIRAQRDMSLGPLASLGLRAHFSYFNDDIEVTNNSVTFSSDVDVYDFGLAAIGGLNFGLIKPYAGIGIGSENFEATADDVQDLDFSDGNSLFWNVLGGVELQIIPVLTPFIEYRFVRLFDDDQFYYDRHSRVAFGILLKI